VQNESRGCRRGFATMVVAMAVLLCLAADASTQTSAPERGDPAKGKTAFMSTGCYTCHGTVGQGGAGARLAPKPLAVTAFIAYVRSGRRGWSIAGGMPAYPPRAISDSALADIWAYLASIAPPPPASSIPLLRD
jgi:ubiquinol-cytochrome c reductase cytochrome c subunit